MQTVTDFLDQVKANSGIQSDYKLAQVMGLTTNTISNYRHGRSRPDDLVLSKLAQLGNIPADQVELLAVTLQAERGAFRPVGRVVRGRLFRLFTQRARHGGTARHGGSSVYYVKLMT